LRNRRSENLKRQRAVTDTNTDQGEAEEIQRAVELIHLGARLQLLEFETRLSRERLVALYEEVTGAAPGATMPPLPSDWFLVWKPNIHASLFISIWRYLKAFVGMQGLDAIVQAYRLYLSHMQATCLDPILSVTRAWTLTRYFGVLLDTAPCSVCGHDFVVSAHALERAPLCGLCRAPADRHSAPRSRAGAVRNTARVPHTQGGNPK
jgi:flagellar transcriptional activator FlhC